MGFLGYDQHRCCRMYWSQYLLAVVYCWWYLACPRGVKQQALQGKKRAITTAVAASGSIVNPNSGFLWLLVQVPENESFQLCYRVLCFRFSRCRVCFGLSFVWIKMDANFFEKQRETLFKIYVLVQEVNQNPNLFFCSWSSMLKNSKKNILSFFPSSYSL